MATEVFRIVLLSTTRASEWVDEGVDPIVGEESRSMALDGIAHAMIGRDPPKKSLSIYPNTSMNICAYFLYI